MANISINQLAAEITKAVREYSSEVEEEILLAKEEISQDTVALLKLNSPKLTGDYAKGWKRKKAGNNIIIYNSFYQLTHLLEYGHVNRDGGRTPGKAHIRPAEEKAIKDYVERVERAIQS